MLVVLPASIQLFTTVSMVVWSKVLLQFQLLLNLLSLVEEIVVLKQPVVLNATIQVPTLARTEIKFVHLEDTRLAELLASCHLNITVLMVFWSKVLHLL